MFLLADAPAALVKLYLSPANQALAERSIHLILTSNEDYLPKAIHSHCAPIVLEFCKILAGTVGKENQLYLACRSSYAGLLDEQDSRCVGRSTAAKLIQDLLPFLTELGGAVIRGLSSESMLVSAGDMVQFTSFLLAMRRAISDWMDWAGAIPKMLYCDTHPQYKDWIGSLHTMFVEILEKTNQCLGKVGEFLARKGVVHGETRLAAWGHLLVVLTQLNRFSKIFEGGAELFHDVLMFRRTPLNFLIRRATRSSCSLRWLLKHKDVTDFESRQNLVLMILPEGKEDYTDMHEMLIDRSQLLAESYEYIGQAEASTLHGGIFMEFKNEEATGPGVLREWFCLLCQSIFNPQNVLFMACPMDQRRFYPNPTSVVDPLHLKYFTFCGRVIALALMHKVQVGIVFDRVFFLQLAGRSISLEDIQDADPCLYMSCKQILEMEVELLDSDVLGLTFVRDIEELGTRRAVELCPGGKDIIVHSKNRVEYVNLLIQHRFVTSISEQVSYFAQGFGDILTNSKFRKFFFQSLDLEDFDRMLGGSDSVIDVKEWKTHTEYNGYKAKDRQICWFWKIVEGLQPEQKRVLLFFWTSVKYLPVDGFRSLASKLYIYKTTESHDRLPTSNTCFYRLCLPPYPSITIMRDRLQLITQEHVSCSFGRY